MVLALRWLASLTIHLDLCNHKILSSGGSQQTPIVEWFDWTLMTWKQHDHGLLSKNSSNLVVTSFPLSAVDCHAGCTCGRVNNLGGARIVGGNEAKVNSEKYLNYKVLDKISIVTRRTPTPG